MNEYQDGKVRLGALLQFDPEKEKDILEKVKELSNSRNIGKFIGNLIRIAFDSPELYNDISGMGKVLRLMEQYGMTPTRVNFFKQLSKDFETAKKKVDEIYDMAYKAYVLAQAGKRLGLEEKADNCLRATFILERQLTDLCSTLGVDNLNHSFASNKLEDAHERADKTLEYIIESYDGILEELKESMAMQAVSIVPNVVSAPAVSNNASPVGTIGDMAKEIKDTDEEYIDLTERPSPKELDDKKLTIEVPKGDMAAMFMSMMNSSDGEE